VSEQERHSPLPIAPQEGQLVRRTRERASDGEPIPTNWVGKEDLVYCRPDFAERIERLDASEIQYLAGKIGDALQETYWIAMGVILDDYFKSDEEV
jgi:hypothetical protein